MRGDQRGRLSRLEDGPTCARCNGSGYEPPHNPDAELDRGPITRLLAELDAIAARQAAADAVGMLRAEGGHRDD